MLFEKAIKYGYTLGALRRLDSHKRIRAGGTYGLDSYQAELELDWEREARARSGFEGGTFKRAINNSVIIFSSSILGAIAGGSSNRPGLGALVGVGVSTLGILGRACIERSLIEKYLAEYEPKF